MRIIERERERKRMRERKRENERERERGREEIYREKWGHSREQQREYI